MQPHLLSPLTNYQNQRQPRSQGLFPCLDHLLSNLGIICSQGSLAALYRSHLRNAFIASEKIENTTGKENLQKWRVVLLGDNCQ